MWISAATGYLSWTYSEKYTCLAVEIAIAAMTFGEQTMFGEFRKLLIAGHTAFLLPVFLFPVVHMFAWKGERVGSWMAIAAILAVSVFQKSAVFSVAVVGVVLFSSIHQKLGNAKQILAGLLVGGMACIVDVSEIYGLCLWATIVGMIKSDRYEICIKNLGILVFDIAVRMSDEPDFAFYAGLSVLALTRYVSITV